MTLTARLPTPLMTKEELIKYMDHIYQDINFLYEQIAVIDADLKKICGCLPASSWHEGITTGIIAQHYCNYHAPVVMN